MLIFITNIRSSRVIYTTIFWSILQGDMRSQKSKL